MPDVDEALARAVHEQYLHQRLAVGEALGTRPSLVGWDELPDEFKESSWRHARDVAQLLAGSGYKITHARDGSTGAGLSDADVERFAEQVHERWVEERMSRGWGFGHERDDKRKLHPDLVPWAELSNDRREIDRYMLRKLPTILLGAGLRGCLARRGISVTAVPV